MPVSPSTPTIFAVDDDEGLLVLIEGALRAEKWNVATATSGANALAWLQKNAADLLLLDLKLGDIEGRKFLSTMAEVNRSTPFIIITGQGDERVAVEMMKLGAVDYLVKDVQFVDLLPIVVRRALQHIFERKRLEREILEISEREQRKFGYNLHDGLGQRLTGLEMFSHALAEKLKGLDVTLAKQARRLNKELRETVTQARLISHSLAPVSLEGEGLMHGLMELTSSINRTSGVKCRFLCDPPVCIHEVATATHLYRIAQEAVNNALKHGQAKKIDIALRQRDDGVEMCVDNNGHPLPSSNSLSSGMGLNVMRYRAEVIGATLSIESIKRKGVRVTCTLRRKA